MSGGEEGARYGPSLMPGGHPAAWPHIKPIFQVSTSSVLKHLFKFAKICCSLSLKQHLFYVSLVSNFMYAFQAVCAKVGTEPCCDWVGENGAGHFVKMVHNGIEYGDMQLICEAYHLMKDVLGIHHQIFR